MIRNQIRKRTVRYVIRNQIRKRTVRYVRSKPIRYLSKTSDKYWVRNKLETWAWEHSDTWIRNQSDTWIRNQSDTWVRRQHNMWVRDQSDIWKRYVSIKLISYTIICEFFNFKVYSGPHFEQDFILVYRSLSSQYSTIILNFLTTSCKLRYFLFHFHKIPFFSRTPWFSYIFEINDVPLRFSTRVIFVWFQEPCMT